MTEMTRSLNIQLDNLCQFLPQEKVVEFTKMSPTELLHSTQRAIGDGELLVMHEKLMAGGAKLRTLEDTKYAHPVTFLSFESFLVRDPLYETTGDSCENGCDCGPTNEKVASQQLLFLRVFTPKYTYPRS